ncbi:MULTISPECIES: caspase family protein [unclassified Nodularia (in: cyanobacteria)]|uniref:caspase family protein n=1 Tax=unclassified Nodularia (in: cyanobacteria) TaxID=2656917 RepID=UPI0018803F9C|nr:MULTISPECIES: caspase family protein [unclassified Nodularia (in: cyanobacteria)]MBE9198874.1 caspase family protein [Nodularia sp. LEGE 06071]MCC2695419.1 caspase family protein [Nodularia sp. LEGE 04288]
MSHIKRRQFVQFAGSALATLGISQWDIMQQGDRIGQVLAQSTPRKLALLVGINQYSGNIVPLSGCVNDVLMQKELLTYRFGFSSQDILTLTDKQATRQNILTAFEEHLIKQAKPGDVVVFHFSGHGSRVQDPDGDSPDKLNSTLVPVDGDLPLGYPYEGGQVQHIMGHTLFLLMSALQTENVTFVLDSCHSGGGTRGIFRVRSIDGGSLLQPSQGELDEQRQWLGKLGMSPQDFIKKRRENIAKGVVIASARREQYAADFPFGDFSAGAFSYLFTQYLWQRAGNEPVSQAILSVRQSTNSLAWEKGIIQNPEIETNLSQENANAPVYFTPKRTLPAEAVITQVRGNEVDLWLGGLDLGSLEAFTNNPYFIALDPTGGQRGLIKLNSRQGLVGKGTLQTTTRQGGTVQPGTILQERIRSIPDNLTLKIGIDGSLESNTAQQARQALQKLPRIEPKPVGQQELQYIFGRMNTAKYQELQKNGISNLPEVDSFGLFLPSLDQIISNSFGKAKETVTEAVQRLQPKLRSLLAARIVKQMLGNTNSSRINITASMNLADNQKLIGETFTPRGAVKKLTEETNQSVPVSLVNAADSGIPKLPTGTEITFQVENNESRPLYVTILVIDAAGDMDVIFPFDWSAVEGATLIQPSQKRVIPLANDGFKLTIVEPFGISEALIIASTTPLRTSLQALQKIAESRGLKNTRSPISVNDEFLGLTNNLLDDLDAGTRGGINVERIPLPAGVRGIDTERLAAMAIAFEVIS